MNLSEVKELKSTDSVLFDIPWPAFTAGKQYKIRNSDIGISVYDDNGRCRPLYDMVHSEWHFERVKEGKDDLL